MNENEMVNSAVTAEKVLPYVNWMQERQPSFSTAAQIKVAQDSLTSHRNSHKK